MPAPLPQSRVGLPQPGNISISPIAQPHLPAAEPIVGALQDIGALATKWYDQLKDARDTTNKANATTDYITKLDALETKYQNDPDYQTAPQRFEAERAALEQSAIAAAGLDKPGSAVLQLTLRQQGLAAFGRVQSKSLARHVSSTVASLDDAEVQYGNLAADATSPTERDMHINHFHAQVDDAVKSGIILPEAGEQYKRRFNATLQEVVVGNMIRENPPAAQAFLANPENTKTIDPKRVVVLRDQAAAANDTLGIDQLVAKMQRDGSYAASATINKVLTPGDRAYIFQNGIIPNEGGRDPQTGKGIIGAAGEIGISQILPETAREVAASLGMTDIAHLSSEDLQARLLNDHVLNAKLGQTYFNQQLARYGGNISLAAAAYNAGPGRADRWERLARAKFGDNFSAAQLASVIDIGTTQDYVLRLYKHLGVDPGGLNLSPHGYYRAIGAATTEIEQQQTADVQTVRKLAAADWSNDPILELMQRGAPVDMPRITAHLAVQDAAAATGDVEAMTRARQIRTAVQVQPLVNSAWSMRPDALAAEVAKREADLQSVGGVQTQTAVDELDALKKVYGAKRETAVQDAAVSRAEDPVDKVLAAGGTVDQERLNKLVAVQVQAAVLGDPASIAYLRDIETQYGMQPLIAAAKTMPPEVVAAEIARRERLVSTQADVDTIAALRKVQTASTADVLERAKVQRADVPVDKLLEAGVKIDPAQFNETVSVQQAAAKLGDPAAIEYLRKVSALARVQPAVDLAAQMQPTVLQTEIERRQIEIQSSGTASEADLLGLTALKAVQAEQAKALASGDIVQAGERAKLYAPVALDLAANPQDGGFRAALTQRSVQATIATQPINVGAGYSPKPFHPPEAAALKQRFEDAGLSEKLGLLDALHSSMSGRVFAAAIDQLGLSGVEQAAAQFADRGELPRKILIGAGYLGVKGVETQATALRDAMQAQLGGDLWGGGGSDALKNVTDAAAAVYVADRGGNAALWKTDDAGALKNAIEEVTGPLTTRNGQRVAVPPTMTTATFNDTLDHMSNEALAKFGGVIDKNGAPLTAQELGQIAVLKQIQPGSSLYNVGTNHGPPDDPFQPFLNATTKAPLIIDMVAANKEPPRPFDKTEGPPGLIQLGPPIAGAAAAAGAAVGGAIQAAPGVIGGAISNIPGAIGGAVQGVYPRGYQSPFPAAPAAPAAPAPATTTFPILPTAAPRRSSPTDKRK